MQKILELQREAEKKLELQSQAKQLEAEMKVRHVHARRTRV